MVGKRDVTSKFSQTGNQHVTKCHEVEAFGFGGWQASEELTSAKLRCGPEGWVMQNLGVIS